MSDWVRLALMVIGGLAVTVAIQALVNWSVDHADREQS
jgi:hypothetical protein